ncbi:FecR family protein [Sphingobacterium griseoflavum]|uniref:Iron dicitrate transporter FecR n=1 Tax=Sphingobacterium griseoflavum TaxID=1474952 RepID=A0ABQ3HUP8_9SPHI|nr:FecR family protein [Sphingobacterium griseoflavum]GHE23113.1 iron dicitrate transporter FecR [Sphingobacterium griseoflavum]
MRFKSVTEILFLKYLHQQTDAEENKRIFKLLANKRFRSRFRKLIAQQLQQNHSQEGRDLEVLQRIYKSLDLTEHARLSRMQYLWLRSSKKWSLAAVALLALALSFSFFIWKAKDNADSFQAVDIGPASKKARLEIADGQIVMLDKNQEGVINVQEGVRLCHDTAGQLYYLHDQKDRAPAVPQRITIPKGGNYQLTLADGTKVWLNAGSSMEFPSYFDGNERVVKLSGEAYFEVTKFAGGRRPFIVETTGQRVIVLGTRFNVKAYADEKESVTTLLSGSVQIATAGETVALKPGQQAQVSQEGVRVSEVDPLIATDWANGDFVFMEESLPSILRKLERWYDIKVVYRSAPSAQTYIAQIGREQHLEDVLNALQRAHHFKYQLAGNVLYIH